MKNSTANVIILAGQSNAVGVGHTQYLPLTYGIDTIRKFHEGYDNIPIWYISHDIQSHGFVKTSTGCTEATKDTLGPEVGMARRLTEAYPHEKFYIIKCAFGGSNMFDGWRSPSTGVPYDPTLTTDYALAINDPRYQFSGWCYHACVKLITQAFDALRAEGLTPSVKAFCWMQGEADTIPPHIDAYIERYHHMLCDLRDAFAPSFDNCLYIDAGISEIWENYAVMNQKKKAHAQDYGHVFLDTIGHGLTTRNEPHDSPDIYHYDVDSTVRLGEMFANAFITTRNS